MPQSAPAGGAGPGAGTCGAAVACLGRREQSPSSDWRPLCSDLPPSHRFGLLERMKGGSRAVALPCSDPGHGPAPRRPGERATPWERPGPAPLAMGPRGSEALGAERLALHRAHRERGPCLLTATGDGGTPGTTAHRGGGEPRPSEQPRPTLGVKSVPPEEPPGPWTRCHYANLCVERLSKFLWRATCQPVSQSLPRTHSHPGPCPTAS